ncbi:succinate dehydrogenase [ubiquinone] cytochrome b small subunit, mitochondrial [Condylostylus longicornis]|uniref:succinate dehydrogenase [ubiquinone] cytochrome b small subunit, mitochondrial n=1 Tax=Condylostylus longicornis TaxID=2530218 RepID=UPI00244DCB9C|nr:succinate dehydrogenase [ubiquinone] cytochrome b small subunit, mitochondrial [Condylostylus longicornis]
MALYLATRQCAKLNLPRILPQIRALQKSSVSSLVPLIKDPLSKQAQVVRNFSLTTPKLSSAQGSHAGLWTAERVLSLALLGILPAAIAFPSQPLDYALAVSMVMHSHWGLEAIVTDYVRPIIFGNVVPKVAHGVLLVFSAATLAGLFYFIYNDIGIAKAVRKLWAIKGQ